MGSQAQELDVIFDTGSDYLVLQAEECRGCKGKAFNASASTTFVETDSDPYIQRYGSGKVVADIVNDTCSFDSGQSLAINDFQFLLST
jgi:hypothetical protein